jgi:hypothetical protein
MFEEFKKQLEEEYEYSPDLKKYVRKELRYKDPWCYFSYKELLIFYIKRKLNLSRTK